VIRSGTLQPEMLLAVAPAIAVVRVLIIIVSLAVWFWTQRLLARRNPSADTPTPSATINDGLHQLTAMFNQRLLDNPRHADALLIASSLVIDLLGFYLLASAIFGITFEPFLGLFMVFALRQTCQAFCPLPPPPGMIWRNPGCPSILVTYGTACDLFFSGHTAIAVYGCLTLASALGTIGIILGCLIAAFEIISVLILRAHYTMDIFTGVLAALYVHRVAIDLAPHVDRWIAHFTSAAA
jgi:hypothetical protein